MKPTEVHMTQIHVTSALKLYFEVVKKYLPLEQAAANTAKSLQGLEFARYFIAQIDPGQKRAQAMHAFVGAMYGEKEFKVATCKKGCGACCYVMPKITRDEAKLITQTLMDNPEIKLDAERMQTWHDEPDKDKWTADRNPCPFLGNDQTCQIYDVRPMICRAHLVRSNPIHCNSHTSPDIKRVINEWAEIILSAWMNESDVGYLADLLTEEMESK